MTDKIPFNDWKKFDIRIGKILKVEDHPNADKLYVLEVDFGSGDNRTIVAGLRLKYKKEELKNRKAVFVANLEPAVIRGIKSDGMILAAGDDYESVVLLQPDKDISVGSGIK